MSAPATALSGLEAAIDAMQDAAGVHTAARVREMEHEHRKPIEKDAAVSRLMVVLTEQTGKPVAYTAAERVVESEPTYAAFLADYREAVGATMRARAQHDAAKARMWNAVRPLEDSVA